MRKITQESVHTFLYNTNTTWSKSNMEVEIDEGYVYLYLHGNGIARRKVATLNIEISNAGWFSNTTKERLNGLPNVSIKQKAGQWYLNGKEWNGEWTTI